MVMKKLLLISGLLFSINSIGQNPLAIPDTLSGTSFSLSLHKDSVQFLPGKKTNTYGINSNHYQGPTLIWRKNDSLNITVNNNIGDTTTVHWHGMHVAAKNDGGPHTMIYDGSSWNPKFKIRNKAATYWYHSHMMGKTAKQALMGIAGLIIVRDSEETVLNLPRKYSVDDFPIIVQCGELDSLHQIMPRGMQDSILLVNGTINPFVHMPAQVVRLRLLNASGERTFNFGFSGSKTFSVIGNDDGLLPAPVSSTRIRLSPGERAEILLNMTGMTGQTIYLMSYASELPMGIQGGPTMPMPSWAPPMNSPLNGIDFNILKIIIDTAITSPITTIASSLVPDTAYPESSAYITRRIYISGDSAMVMDGPFYFNDSLFNMDRIDYTIPINHTEIWKVVNNTMVAHPFHIHDEHFYILDRHGVAPDNIEKGKKDVILVPPYDSARFIVRFTDFADSTTPFMYHCHILMHEDDGMMGQFLVVNGPVGVTKIENNACMKVSVYPNPANAYWNITVYTNGQTLLAEVYNIIGRCVYSNSIPKTNNTFSFQINNELMSNGMYFLKLSDGNISSIVHLIK